jgi:anion-transporting  ArsA/GET3 family ATPase
MARAVRSPCEMPVRLHVVVGKGGVGKSTVSAALALAAARTGARVLAIELEELGGLSQMLAVRPGRAGEIVSGPSGIGVSWFEGDAALAEYLERVVRLGKMLKPVVHHPLYRAFTAAAPGLGELMVIGKVRDELLLRKDGRRARWDTIVIDAGASGHALELLRMPLVAAKTFRAGRVHRESSKIHELLADPGRTRVQVVTTAEQMAVAEAIELAERVRLEAGMTVGAFIVNACRAPAPDGVHAALALISDAEIRAAMSALVSRVIAWQRLQAQAIAVLEQKSGQRALRLPLLASASIGGRELELLSRTLEELAR